MSKNLLRTIYVLNYVGLFSSFIFYNYFLLFGDIGWINDDCIINNIDLISYSSNSSYNGYSMVDALKQINIDSFNSYRSKLSSINDIDNYVEVQNKIYCY